MSVESAKAFLERMKTDEEFAKRVVSCPDESRIVCVRDAGFDFTQEELNKAFSFLSEEDLSRISGGDAPAMAMGNLFISSGHELF